MKRYIVCWTTLAFKTSQHSDEISLYQNFDFVELYPFARDFLKSSCNNYNPTLYQEI